MVDVSGQAVVAVLTRAPSASGKTRLFAALDCVPDRELLMALLLDTLDVVFASGLACAVCFTPAAAEREMRQLLPADVLLLSQRGTDLGMRMRAAFDDLLGLGASAVMLIGSDLPALDPAHLIAARSVLADRAHAVVLGPATDGGYYLVGATRTPETLLDGIEWSTADVLKQTLTRADRMGIATELLPWVSDVDTIDDLRDLVASPSRATRTKQWWGIRGR